MLNIDPIQNGIVIDHIQPGGMDAVSDVVRDMGRVDMVICALRDGVRLRGQLSIPVYCVRV